MLIRLSSRVRWSSSYIVGILRSAEEGGGRFSEPDDLGSRCPREDRGELHFPSSHHVPMSGPLIRFLLVCLRWVCVFDLRSDQP